MEGRIREQEMTARIQELQQAGQIEVGGETNISNDVIATIVGIAAQEVDGVSALGSSSMRSTIAERMGMGGQRMRGISVEAGRKEAIIDLSLRVKYGYSIPQVIQGVRKNVASRLMETCGLMAKEINVDVVGIDFPERSRTRVE